MADIRYVEIDEIPEYSERRGPRESECLKAYLATVQSPKKKIQVEASDDEHLTKFYKSMMQWRNRHKDKKLNVRRDGDKVYLWVDEDVERSNGDGTRRRGRPPKS